MELFIGTILLPFTVCPSNFAKTAAIAKANQMELVFHLTVCMALGISFFILPVLTIISAVMGDLIFLHF